MRLVALCGGKVQGCLILELAHIRFCSISQRHQIFICWWNFNTVLHLCALNMWFSWNLTAPCCIYLIFLVVVVSGGGGWASDPSRHVLPVLCASVSDSDKWTSVLQCAGQKAASRDCCKVCCKFFHGNRKFIHCCRPCASRLHISCLKMSETECSFFMSQDESSF